MKNLGVWIFLITNNGAGASEPDIFSKDAHSDPSGPAEDSPEAERALAEARATYRANFFYPANHYRLAKALFWSGRYSDAGLMEGYVAHLFPREEAGTAWKATFALELSPEEVRAMVISASWDACVLASRANRNSSTL